MSGELRPTRYAHCEGHTDVCYSQDGKRLITCGEDGEVRVFLGLDDDDCLTHSIGDQAFAVAYKFPNLLVGADSNCIQYLDIEDGAPGQVLTRFTAQPTCIDVQGKMVAAGSSDMTVCVHDTLDYRDTVLEGHTAPILSVAMDPKGEYVASSSCDGTVKIWVVATQSLVKTFPDLHVKSNQFRASCTLCRMTFTPTGDHLLVPVADKVVVYARSTWAKEREFGHPDVNTALSIVAVSRCGALVATCTAAGHISVHTLSTGALLLAVQHPKKLAITGLVWSPAQGVRELAFVDAQGQLGTVVNIAGKSSNTATAAASDVFPPAEVDDNLDDMLAEINKEDDFQFPDDDNEVSIAQIKSQMGFADDEHGTFLGVPKADAETDGTAAPLPTSRPSTPPPPGPKLPELQRCFTPSMTPEHHSQRYMLWNNVGAIKQYNLEEDCSIGVEFHDTSLHHSIHQPNSAPCYTIAALSDQALVLGAEATSDGPSRVSVQLLCGGVGGQDWLVDLPQGEDVVALAASSKIVCIVSDRRIVRVLSIGGACSDVLSVPGQLVCVAAHRHLLMVLYHAGVGAAGDQQIHMVVLNTTPCPGQRPPAPTPAPVSLSPKAFVAWAGFTDEGTPVVVDSDGLVRMMHPKYPGIWTVILASKELTKGRSDHHFILGVSESEGKIRSILCKGSRYPPVVPPPYVTLLDYKIPVFDESSEKGELEASILQSDLQLATLNRVQKSGTHDVSGQLQDTELLLQTTLIKLFALSCRSGREVRALDVCRLMTDRTMQSANKYAAKLGRGDLAERVADCLEERRAREEEEQDRLDSFPDHSLANTPTGSFQSLSLPPHSGTVASTPHSEAAQHSEEEVEEEEEDDSVADTDAATPTNPLLAAAARRSKHHNLSLGSSLMASKVNPFRKPTPRPSTASPDGARQGLEMLSQYKPKVDSSAPILRPVLKKKSKNDRGLAKTAAAASSQPPLQSKLSQSFLTKGKENQNKLPKAAYVDKVTDNASHNTTSSPSSAVAATAASVATFASSAMYKATIAMHLWWADNEEAVRGSNSDAEMKLLVPKAAIMFKDVPSDVKARYKKLASDNAAAAAASKPTPEDIAPGDSQTEGENKRKREDNATPEPVTETNLKKLKPGSGIAKLAAFAFSKA